MESLKGGQWVGDDEGHTGALVENTPFFPFVCLWVFMTTFNVNYKGFSGASVKGNKTQKKIEKREDKYIQKS